MILERTWDEIKVGDAARVRKTLTEADATFYVTATWDFSPVHINESYASTTRFGHRIAPGVMVAGLMTAVLGNDLVGCRPISTSDEFRFLAPIYYGDTITVEVTVMEKVEAKKLLKLGAIFTNQDGKVVIKATAGMVFVAN